MNLPGSCALERNLDCPFLDPHCCVCGATIRPMRPDTRQQRLFCRGDNHDDCPFYLAFLLRRSRPKSRHSLKSEFSQK